MAEVSTLLERAFPLVVLHMKVPFAPLKAQAPIFTLAALVDSKRSASQIKPPNVPKTSSLAGTLGGFFSVTGAFGAAFLSFRSHAACSFSRN